MTPAWDTTVNFCLERVSEKPLVNSGFALWVHPRVRYRSIQMPRVVGAYVVGAYVVGAYVVGAHRAG